VPGVPNCVFLSLGSTKDSRFAGWAAFRNAIGAARIVGETPAVPPVTSPVDAQAVSAPVGVWRLLASNNRELARSWRAYPSFEAARAEVERLQQRADALQIAVVRGESASHYGWFALLDGEPVISSGRWFGASSTSQHSAETALAELALATITEAPATVAAQSKSRLSLRSSTASRS